MPPAPTNAYAVAVSVGGYRGVVAVRESDGRVETPDDEATAQAQTALAREGLWQEQSGAIGLAGLRAAARAGRVPSGPIVCIATSSGFKDVATGAHTIPEIAPDWATVGATLRRKYGIA